MTNSDENARIILKKIEEERLLRESQHASNLEYQKSNSLALKEIQELLKERQPMFDAFNAMTGAGRVAKFIGAWVIVPLVVLAGLLLTLKQLISK